MKNKPAHNEFIDISVIIVNYKSWKHLQNCLKSLEKIIQDEFTFEVIVVDNQSNDDKLNEFIEKFPNYIFTINKGNYGFSSGCNLGANKAKGEYLLFLNPDTIVTKEALLTILQISKENLDYGIVSCTKVNLEGKTEKEIRFFPKLSTLLGTFRAFHKLINKKSISKKYHSSKEIVFPDWVSGSIIFTSKKWFKKINGWCEDYWLYLEDVDFCKRITESGGKIALIRATQIIHNHGGASRINVKTSALTKAEVIISKHTYIHNHFRNFSKYLAQFLLFIFTFLTKLLLAIVGTVFFFVPKLYVNVLIFKNLIKYYLNALIKQTWVSKRAPNYVK
ncbi:glycosyltransferase family 2 protein [Flaviramulus sp. BrNp1-15]|uniref:glycosyltransferase family 2 protein n=1 Tax=Flaviramulus sp. BrNp1-15 TaxID=2916754 RepID=UPI001EE7EEAF|nr:glycosyltransferase family 2 protein [Flaviramulus sp. BrNp1-15]ULC58698.1 glycosyltransferase family 2 protein [Flaviramulus sp. BrNp1-15]